MYITSNHWSKNCLDPVVVAGDARQGELLKGSIHPDLQGRATALRHEGTNEGDQEKPGAKTIHLANGYRAFFLFNSCDWNLGESTRRLLWSEQRSRDFC